MHKRLSISDWSDKLYISMQTIDCLFFAHKIPFAGYFIVFTKKVYFLFIYLQFCIDKVIFVLFLFFIALNFVYLDKQNRLPGV